MHASVFNALACA